MPDTRSGSERCGGSPNYPRLVRFEPPTFCPGCPDCTPASPGDEGQGKRAVEIVIPPDEPRTCPTCGTQVIVVSGSEGTNHYRPLGIDRSEVEAVREDFRREAGSALAAVASTPHRSQWHAGLEAAWRTAAQRLSALLEGDRNA